MEVHTGVVFKIKPNARQRKVLAQHFGQARFVYNHFLAERVREYRETKTNSTYFKDCKKLTALKAATPWMYEVSTSAQQNTLKNLNHAFKNFLRGKSKHPTFKKKGGDQTFTQSATEVRVVGKKLKLPKLTEGLSFNRSLPRFSRVVSASVRLTAGGEYYASLCVVSEKERLPPTGNQTGIDLGLTDLAVFSTGHRIPAPKHFRRHKQRLKQAQQHLSRKVKGSKRRDIQRQKVGAIHRQIANARKDTLHKASAYAVRNHDVIAVETLAVANILKNRKLALSVSDAGWGEFIRQLEYKATWKGRKFLKVGRFYPSSRACSGCGWIHKGLKLSERVWNCQQCGTNHDRDLNAATNILNEALKPKRLAPVTGVEVDALILPVKRPAILGTSSDNLKGKKMKRTIPAHPPVSKEGA